MITSVIYSRMAMWSFSAKKRLGRDLVSSESDFFPETLKRSVSGQNWGH